MYFSVFYFFNYVLLYDTFSCEAHWVCLVYEMCHIKKVPCLALLGHSDILNHSHNDVTILFVSPSSSCGLSRPRVGEVPGMLRPHPERTEDRLRRGHSRRALSSSSQKEVQKMHRLLRPSGRILQSGERSLLSLTLMGWGTSKCLKRW